MAINDWLNIHHCFFHFVLHRNNSYISIVLLFLSGQTSSCPLIPTRPSEFSLRMIGVNAQWISGKSLLFAYFTVQPWTAGLWTAIWYTGGQDKKDCSVHTVSPKSAGMALTLSEPHFSSLTARCKRLVKTTHNLFANQKQELWHLFHFCNLSVFAARKWHVCLCEHMTQSGRLLSRSSYFFWLHCIQYLHRLSLRE